MDHPAYDPHAPNADPSVPINTSTPINGQVILVDYDPTWPEMYAREEARILTALGDRTLRIEHIGFTSVPGLCAKPCIDILLVVADSADELSYVPTSKTPDMPCTGASQSGMSTAFSRDGTSTSISTSGHSVTRSSTSTSPSGIGCGVTPKIGTAMPKRSDIWHQCIGRR
jgi:GrpB-like predicted nucleotidyltransferase (UPF0157 family)